MKVIGDITIMENCQFYIDLLSEFDIQILIDIDARDNIETPSDGDLVITLNDYNLNVYDSTIGCWKQFKTSNVHNIAVCSSNSNTSYYCSMYSLRISTTGNAEYFGEMTMGRYDCAVFSNGVGGIGVFAGGYIKYPWIAGNATYSYTNYVDYIQIGNSNCQSCRFGNLALRKRWAAGTSNAEFSTGVIGGGNGDGSSYCWELQYYNIRTKANANHGGYLWNAGTQHGGAFLSNATGNRGIYAGGYGGRSQSWYPTYNQVIEYITISSSGSSSDFGDLSPLYCSGVGGLSNGELNRGIFNIGWIWNQGNTTRMDYINITTRSNSVFFGNLNLSRNLVAPTSNRINNRGVTASSAYSTNSIDYITISTLGDAIDFGDLPVIINATKMVSNS